MDIKRNLLDILVCPICKAKLKYIQKNGELVCRWDRLAFPVREGIPIMLDAEARKMSLEEIENIN